MNFTRHGLARLGTQLRCQACSTILTTLIREEFTRHGLTDTITLTHRNVCKDGFTVVDTADSGEFLRSDNIVRVMLTYF